MSEREMREVLQAVIDDIDTGRLAVPPLRSRLVRYLGPPLVAASLGLTGCIDRDVEPARDSSTQDATIQNDGAQPAYIAPFDGAVIEYAAPFDGSVDPDGGVQPAYIAPFDGAVIEYAAPFDAEVEDGGAVPLYMGPPPPEDR